MMSSVREWKFGGSHVRFEAPDVLFHKVWGDTSLEECQEFMALYQQLGSHTPFFAVVDMSEANRVDDDARRYVSEALQSEWFLGVIYVRARLIHKAVARGITLFHKLIGRPVVEPYFVSTEAEARELIAQLRGQGTHPMA